MTEATVAAATTPPPVVAAAAPAKAAKAPKVPKEPKVVVAKEPKSARPTQNGMSRPPSSTITGKVWDAADAVSEKKQAPATIAEVRALIPEVNPATVATQYGKWRRFHGLKRPEKVVAVVAEGAAPGAEATPAA